VTAALLRRGREGGDNPPPATCKCCNNSFPAVHRKPSWRIMFGMKLLHATVGAVALLAAVAASSPAFAGGGYRGYYGPRVGVGIAIGAPLWGPAWYPRPYPFYAPYAYPYPYYSYPYSYYPPYAPALPVPAAPPVYIERSDVAPAPAPQQQQPQQAPQQTQYWYYCAGSRAYYPYVKECAGGWQQVAPQPPS